jgi:hypothetical protein
MSLTKQIVQQQFNKKPDVDQENQSVELYCTEHQSNGKSYVFHGEELVFEGYPYSIELVQSSLEKNPTDKGFDFEKCKFFEAHEGTLIRIFNIEGKWYVSTNRRLNAFNSKWAGKTTTFGVSFADAVRRLVDDEVYEEEEESLESRKKNAKEYLTKMCEKNLDVSKKYMFLLKPCAEERIVCNPSNSILNIGVFDSSNNLYLDEDVSFEGCVVPRPEKFQFKTFSNMIERLDAVDITATQGFIAIQEGKIHYKIFNDRYNYLFSLRGNVSSIRFRYLELAHLVATCKGYTEEHIRDFLKLYPEFDPVPLQNFIWNVVVDDLHKKYMDVYVMKKLQTVPQKIMDMLTKIHDCYRRSRVRTDKTRIQDVLIFQKPSLVNQLINEYTTMAKKEAREC